MTHLVQCMLLCIGVISKVDSTYCYNNRDWQSLVTNVPDLVFVKTEKCIRPGSVVEFFFASY